MSARDNILTTIKAGQPPVVPLPAVPDFAPSFEDAVLKFKTTLAGLGGEVHEVSGTEEIIRILQSKFPSVHRVVSALPGFLLFAEAGASGLPHSLENVDLAVIGAHFAVAENGALWVTDEQLPERALPFIAQHLAAVVSRRDIFATLHDAYSKIGDSSYAFGTFIAGPSKTADIEQSLVLGAHGAKSMTVFITTN